MEVNPLTKAELKPWSGDYKKVPIALIDGDQVNGSEQIMEHILKSPYIHNILEKKWADNSDEEDSANMTMQQFQESENAQKWIRFAADDLAALLYPNICGSVSDSYDAFGYVKNVETWSAFQKVSIQSLGALAMYFAASRVKCEYEYIILCTIDIICISFCSFCNILLQQNEISRMRRKHLKMHWTSTKVRDCKMENRSIHLDSRLQI